MANPQMPISEDEYMKITGQVMRDKSPLTVSLSIMEAWVLVSNLQLAHRHPGTSDAMKEYVQTIAKRFEAAIVEIHPEAEPLIEMGWNPQFDVDENGDFIEDDEPEFHFFSFGLGDYPSEDLEDFEEAEWDDDEEWEDG